ncbi:MAG: rRNA maturation RNase YbeY [Sphingobacteriales bacterium]|jgi:probable rRNA maturation factor|nr:rRNA maturation RNase YbeY [Sphingobacteriales bacterium]
MAILFHFNTISKPRFFKPAQLKPWIKSIAAKERFVIKELNYIFLSDVELLKINMDYLNHDTYTDIITFDNSGVKGQIEGDVFISLERVEENAGKFRVSFENELNRVLAHGLLHLCGYKDKTKKDAILMRQKEEESLVLFHNN